MFRRDLGCKVRSAFWPRWSVLDSKNETDKTLVNFSSCLQTELNGSGIRFSKQFEFWQTTFGRWLCVNQERTRACRILGIRHVGSSATDSPDVIVAKNTELQRMADEKRLLIQKRKQAKRTERIEKQKQRLEKTVDRTDAKYEIPTEIGDKKDITSPLPEAYSPQFVEAAWYDWWHKQGFFTPEFTYNQKLASEHEVERFVMCLPPPNITGTLHLGHALGNAIQDAIARWHRMNGRAVLWNPGCDHAGIATQVVVEKKLWKEWKLDRQNIGRERFISEVWKWKEEKGGRILDQMKRLGSSLDWSRDCFTLDPKMTRAVNESFIQLFDADVIYRNKRLVNWSCALSSAISDIEVENLSLDGMTLVEVPGYEKKIPFGLISSFAYTVEGSDEKITVSTTRLETMLGDTAIAIHPSDGRYSHLHGKYAQHPFCNRLLPIVFDEMVDPAFGTGAVKVTPAHDHSDFEIGLRHKLEMLTILAADGTMTNVPHEFQGLKRFDAREKVRQGLEELALYRGTSDHSMNLPICSRSKDIVEFLLKDQWFVRCEEMSNKAIQAVESGRLKLIPEHYGKQWKDWLQKTRDWCISRQLWWGHRIPAYRVRRSDEDSELSDGESWVAAQSTEEAVAKAAIRFKLPKDKVTVEQDDDVLDTWFSSALFPFAIFGWPDKTDDLNRFYPTNLLETASDIMFFWVARMVMLGEALTGQLPFKEVLFHSVLRDAHGRKMSKSLGNVIDPMDIIHGTSLEALNAGLEKSNLDASEVKLASAGLAHDFPLGIPECGADALRFTLCSYSYTGHFVNVDINHMKSSRNFCNKIWQTYRFVSAHLGDNFTPADLHTLSLNSATDRWIMSRLSSVVEICDRSFAKYNLMDATKALYNFWWFELCDVYLECSKPILQTGTSLQVTNVKNILYQCLNTSLRMIAPFMPFLAEELYQRMQHHLEPRYPSVMVAPFPRPSEYCFSDEDAEEGMNVVRDVVARLLSLRRDIDLRKLKANVYIGTTSPFVHQALADHHLGLLTLSRSETMTFLDEHQTKPTGCISVRGESLDWTVHIKLKGLIDEKQELDRLSQQRIKLEEDLEKLYTKQNDKRTVEEDRFIINEKIRNTSAAYKRIVHIISALEKLNSE